MLKKSKSKAKSADNLLKTAGKKKDIELTEKELRKVSGGETAKNMIPSIGR
jgi:bacteriocin-like protein